MATVTVPAGGRVLLDSMCFIYIAEKVAPYAAALAPLQAEIAAGRVQGAVTSLALAEVLVKPLRDGDVALTDRFRDLLRNTANVSMVSLEPEVSELAADIRARYGLGTPDAVHIATAIHSGCSHIVTNDLDWKRVTECEVIVLKEVVKAP